MDLAKKGFSNSVNTINYYEDDEDDDEEHHKENYGGSFIYS